MNDFKIQCENVTMSDALKQVEALPDVDVKRKSCLLLLTEEMFSMLSSLIGKHKAVFEISRTGSEYTLGLKRKAFIPAEAKDEYLSMSTDGKNIAHKGIVGKIKGIFEYLAMSDVSDSESKNLMPTLCGMETGCGDYSKLWSMSLYFKNTSEEEKRSDWDGMEKSIIASFADDVLIGVKNDHVEMLVKKSF